MWNYMRTIGIAAIIMAALAMACVDGDGDDEPDVQTGIEALTELGVEQENDVKWMKYTVTACGEKEVLYQSKKRLKDLTLPGGIPKFVKHPFAEHSSHRFADYLLLVDTGCYDVYVQPLDKNKKKSKKCMPVHKKDIEVKKGKTTEVLLVSQCKGEKKGLLDVVAALNHPPKLTILDLDPQKFVQCPDEGKPAVTICAEATDKDDDPIRLTWDVLKGQDGIKSLEVIEDSQYASAGVAGECVEVKFERSDGAYKFKLTAFDEFVKFKNSEGQLITAEKWFAKHGFKGKKGEPIKSRASLKFPIYVGDCDRPVDFICPRTIGFWRNPPQNEDLVNQRWEKQTKSTYDISEEVCAGHPNAIRWLDILIDPPLGNMYLILGKQYVAAQLNRAAGATGIAAVDEATDADIAAAQMMLEGGDACDEQGGDWDEQTRQEAEDLKDSLEAFNKFCQPLSNGNIVE